MNRLLSIIAFCAAFAVSFAHAQQNKNLPLSIQNQNQSSDFEEDFDSIEDAYLEEILNAQEAQTPIVQTPNSSKTLENTKTSGDDKLSKDVTLTDMIAEKTGKQKKESRETWIDAAREDIRNELMSRKDNNDSGQENSDGKTSNKNKPLVSLKSMLEESRSGGGRSNAAVFNISGAMLRMTPQQIESILIRRGYKKTKEKFEIPNFIKWRKEDECRKKGVVGYERLASCVVVAAKKDNYQYIETVYYSKFDTQETITIRFTSNFTNNKAYVITYTTEAANVKGNSPKANYLRNIKVYDFWKQINQKYGAPDDKQNAIWGLGGNRPYMQAKTGKLLLEDPMLRELDYTRMSREDQRFINTGTYNF